MQIRVEQPRDHAAILEIHRRAFGASGDRVAALVDALHADDPAALGLVAELDGEVVGHVMFSRSLLDAPRRIVAVQVLSPLGVHPDHQRRGIGGALVRHGLPLLDRRAVPLVFVEGDPRYYARLGFTPGIAHGFRKPSLRVPDDAFQVMVLTAHEPWMTGTLVYSATFWNHDSVGLRDPTGEGS
jgi:putative acetyltransferase